MGAVAEHAIDGAAVAGAVDALAAFARVATDGSRALLATVNVGVRVIAFVMRADREPVLLRDDTGRVCASLGRGWAVVGPDDDPATAGFPASARVAGDPRREDTADVAAAVAAMDAGTVRVPSGPVADLVRAVRGDRDVITVREPDAVAAVLASCPPGAALVVAPKLPMYGPPRVLTCDPETAVSRLRRVLAWGVPPPVDSICALAAFGEAVVRGAELPDPDSLPKATRADLARMLLARCGSVAAESRVVRVRGRVWRVFDLSSLGGRRHPWAWTAGFAADGEEARVEDPPRTLVPEGFPVDPEADVAFSCDIEREPCVAAPRYMPAVYGMACEALAGWKPAADPLGTRILLAAGLASSRPRRIGLSLLAEIPAVRPQGVPQPLMLPVR